MSDSVSGISRADVAHLADLARISLSDDELDHLASELRRSWSTSGSSRT